VFQQQTSIEMGTRCSGALKRWVFECTVALMKLIDFLRCRCGDQRVSAATLIQGSALQRTISKEENQSTLLENQCSRVF
jgi:hypothetical protein